MFAQINSSFFQKLNKQKVLIIPNIWSLRLYKIMQIAFYLYIGYLSLS